MIRRISLHNVGVFENARVPDNLKRIVLIYAENATGKTTLAEVLRSLETNDSSIVVKKHKFEAGNDQHVVLECDGDPPKVVFQNRGWETKRPPVRVFDEAFIDSNVYSGLDVDAGHRQNLYYLALGEQGVYLSRRRNELGKDINQYNKDMREAEKAIPADQRHELSMNKFCDIQEVPNIETEIEKAQQDLDAIQDADIILNTQKFEKISLPAFDESAIRQILQRDLQDLDAKVAARVARHIESLGHRGESWIAEGMGYVSDDAKVCPFCGQETTGASLVGHYRAYFSEAYANLKRNIEGMINVVRSTHSSDAQTTFERTVGANRTNGHVWAKYGLMLPDIDTKAIVDDWISALNAAVEVLEAKQAAPLERMSWDNDTLGSYELHRQRIANINATLDAHNDKIKKMKEMVSAADVQSICNRLRWLALAKERYSPMTAAWCDKYLQAKSAKAEANAEKVQVTEQLKEYRKNAFPALQMRVNQYLRRFGVRFAMGSLKPLNIGSGSSCSYTVLVDNTPIGTNNAKSEDDPSIGETLSTSDRNTFALALFLSSLEKDENLADTTVVIDDPVSSFDDNRSMATVQELRKLATRVGQIIILSHKAAFLGKIWRKVDQKQCQSLTMVHRGNGSDICDWDIGRAFNADQAQWQLLLEAYAKDKTGDRLEVIGAIRLYLEAVLEILCAGHYNASKPIGTFLSECKDKCGTMNEILDEDTVVELQDIYEYASPNKHGSHIDPENTDINGEELRNYAGRALDVTKLSVSKSSLLYS